jgi:pilus assembly protein FimV
LADHQDNEALDFDLGPYPGKAQNAEADNTFALDENSFQLDDSDAKDDLETFEFDFNLSETDSDKPIKTAALEPQDSWDAEQTIDFSMADSDSETDALGNDTIDFNFDFDTPLTSPAKTGQNDGFAVSDLTDMDEMETKLDLAKAYIDMGDAESAKDIIGQVLNKGSAEQKKIAQTLLDELG